MKVDLVERLREAATKPNGWAILGAPAATEAADAIESLRQQLAESNVILQEAKALHSRLAEAEAYGKAQQRWAHEWREKADGLEARLAEANALLREARDKHWPFMATDGLAARIDAHLAREQP